MAVWLSMSMSYVGAGGSANTSRVLVSVDVSWNYPHFNRDGGTLNVTVDGVTDTKTVPFNAGETNNGSQNLYSYYWDIAQPNGAAKNVSAYATFQATSNTTATPASATLSLPAIGGSSGGDSGDSGETPGGETPGGDSGGGNSGGDSGGGGDSGDDSGDDSGGGDYGGDSGGGNPENVLAAEPGNATVINNIFFGYDTTLSPDNYHTIGGQVVAESGNNRIGIIRFETPNFEGASTSVDLRFSVGNVYGNSQTVNFAICTADAYAFSYIVYPDSISDPYAIASGTIQLTANSICSVTVPTSALKGNTTYYVFLWFPYTTSNFVYADINKTEWHGIDVNYKKDFVYIDSGSGFGTYQCFIDNGTNWDPVKVFIDNGSEFIPYS